MARAEILGLALMPMACGFALWRGRGPERRAAVAIAVAWVGSVAVDVDGWHGVQWGIMAIDMVLLAYLAALTVVSRRTWLLFATAFQLLIVATHFAFVFDSAVGNPGFFSAYYLWSWLELACLAWGAAVAPRPGRPAARDGNAGPAALEG